MQRKGRHRLEKDGSYSSLSDNGNSPALSRGEYIQLSLQVLVKIMAVFGFYPFNLYSAGIDFSRV